MPGTMKRIAIATAVLCFALPAWGASGTRVSSFEYDPATGLLLKEIVEPDNAQLRLDTTYVRDGYGNKTSATISSPATGEAAIVSRSATAAFDSQGRFNTVTTNALSHSETKAYDTRFGLPTSHTSPNSQVSQWQYDGFGRKTLEIAPDGNRTQFQYLFCSGVAGGSATCPTNAKYVVRATPRAADGVTQNGPIKSVYFDALDREIRSETQGFDGSQIVTAKQFDTRGRLAQASRPYFSSQTPKWIAYQYDDLARKTRQTEPNNAITQYAYNGLVYTVTNALNQTRTETKNSQGKVITVRDHLNGTTTFAFDPFENLTSVTDAAGNVSTMGYDIRGRKTSMTDPDMGAWTYVYDAVGQMVRQVDAKAQETVTGYDKLGRMTSRVSAGLSSSWTYDTATNGIGKVASMATTAGFSKSLTYDSLSRPSQSTTIIDGQTYTSASTYDANGRLATVVYPSGFTVRYVYTALGYQSEARNDATNALFWRTDTMNAELQLTAFTHGNNVATTQVFDANTGRLTATQAGSGNTVQNAGYVWDNVGNMTQRSDATQALVETFIHDGLNRLTSSEIFGSPAKTVTYNAIGNIVTKSDVGTYTYPTTGSARPHAVASIAGSVTTSFTYDANGNMLTGAARTLTWTSFNMPATIARGASTVGFTYDPEYNRIKQTTPDGFTHYLWDSASGVNIEKFIGFGGSTQWSNYVFAGGQMVAVFYERTPGPSATRYFHKDHLGSLAVITDEAGAVSERLAYDSWGKRRHANGADDPGEAITSQSNRGYTGHEHLEEVGLVHMNGRIYEPLVARVMSSDPIVQDPFSTQSLNRYSYVMNNPMAYTDPTGFSRYTPEFYFQLQNGGYPSGADYTLVGTSNGNLFVVNDAVVSSFAPISKASAVGTNAVGMITDTTDGKLHDQSQVGTKGAASTPARGYRGSLPGAMGHTGPVILVTDDSSSNNGSFPKTHNGGPPLDDDDFSPRVTIPKTWGAAAVVGLTVFFYTDNSPWEKRWEESHDIWKSIKPTQENYPGLQIPRSFELTAGETKVWVSGNASEHLYEYFNGMLNRGVSVWQVNIGTQVQLKSLQAAVGEATSQGITFGKIGQFGGWELKFEPARQPGQLPSLVHALPLPKGPK